MRKRFMKNLSHRPYDYMVIYSNILKLCYELSQTYQLLQRDYFSVPEKSNNYNINVIISFNCASFSFGMIKFAQLCCLKVMNVCCSKDLFVCGYKSHFCMSYVNLYGTPLSDVENNGVY